MHANGARLVMPLLNFLDEIIRQYGDYLFMFLCFAAVALIVYILKGGLRRKLPRSPATSPGSIIVIKTLGRREPPLPPPIVERESDPLSNHSDSEHFVE
jgi:hypothetical protein